MSRVVPENPPGTPGLRRATALVPLSQDHHAALVQAQALSRAASGKSPYHRPGAPERVARGFLAFRLAELAGHFGDEEEVLLPASERVDPEGTARVRAEHEQMNALAARLEAALAAGHDLRPVMSELGALLHDHVRYEERAFFESLQTRLLGDELDRLGRAIAARREARGISGATCAVLPPR